LLGDPIAHSVSPALHNAAFGALRLPGRYSARRVPPERLTEAVTELRRAEYRGVNVTIPHKEAALPLVDDVTPDAAGLLAAREGDLGIVPYGVRILLLGAGGAPPPAPASTSSLRPDRAGERGATIAASAPSAW